MKRQALPGKGRLWRAATVAIALAWFTPAVATGPTADGPVLDRARSGPCVRDPRLMRRIHMELLIHGRDQTVHLGIRDRKESLAACVDCHANAKDGSVLGSDTHFCQGCHAYAAVKIDCFECHSSHARTPARTVLSTAGKAGS